MEEFERDELFEAWEAMAERVKVRMDKNSYHVGYNDYALGLSRSHNPYLFYDEDNPNTIRSWYEGWDDRHAKKPHRFNTYRQDE